MNESMTEAGLLHNQLLLIKNADITATTSFDEATNDAHCNDKLLLIYIYDSYSESNNFINILCNSDVNSLFKSDFTIYIATVDAFKAEFQYLVGGEVEDVTNKLYTFALRKHGPQCVSTISVLDTPQADILYALYMNHKSFQDETVKECATDYLEVFNWNINDDYPYISIKRALDTTMFESTPHLRRILMIYMYKQDSALTAQINQFLQINKLEKHKRMMSSVFWNIADKRYHKALKQTCNRYFEELEATVSSDEGGVFFLMSEKGDDSTLRIVTEVTSSEAFKDPVVLCRTLDSMLEDLQEFNQITDFFELEAIDSYQNKTFEGYMQRLSLHDVMEMCLGTPRKLLLFYFYAGYSQLDRSLNCLQPFLHAEQVAFLPWDITDAKRNAQLAKSAQRTFAMKKMDSILQARQSALFIFLPYGHTLALHATLTAKASASAVKDAYNAAHQFFTTDSELGDDDSFGPADYHQIMCDHFGVRKTYCFQFNETRVLRSKIGYLYYGEPKTPQSYSANQEKRIDATFKIITNEASKFHEKGQLMPAYVSFMQVVITPLPEEKQNKLRKNASYVPALDFAVRPLFGIHKSYDHPQMPSPCMKYIDHFGRTYEGWEDFLQNNKFLKVVVIAPRNGKYTCDYRGRVQLEICPSPTCSVGYNVMVSALTGLLGVHALSTKALIDFIKRFEITDFTSNMGRHRVLMWLNDRTFTNKIHQILEPFHPYILEELLIVVERCYEDRLSATETERCAVFSLAIEFFQSEVNTLPSNRPYMKTNCRITAMEKLIVMSTCSMDNLIRRLNAFINNIVFKMKKSEQLEHCANNNW